MFLTKWYADWVGPDGPHVVYRAALALGPIRLGFDGGHDPAGGAHAAYTVGLPPMPLMRDRCLEWPSEAGGRRWSDAAPRRFDLLPQRPGRVIWEPVCLNGAVTGPGIRPGRRGYAERLGLSVAPWSLGLRLLRWGRFCGERMSLAWIVWDGAVPLQFALVDGAPEPLHSAGPDHVEAGRAVLSIVGTRPFVEAPLSHGLLRTMPWPKRIRPLAFLDGVEVKSWGHGRLHVGDRVDEGSVILEEVRWS